MVVIAILSKFGACLPSSRAEKCVVAIAWGSGCGSGVLGMPCGREVTGS